MKAFTEHDKMQLEARRHDYMMQVWRGNMDGDFYSSVLNMFTKKGHKVPNLASYHWNLLNGKKQAEEKQKQEFKPDAVLWHFQDRR